MLFNEPKWRSLRKILEAVPIATSGRKKKVKKSVAVFAKIAMLFASLCIQSSFTFAQGSSAVTGDGLGASMLVGYRGVAATAQQPQAAASAPVAPTSKAAESLLNADRSLAAESHAIGFKAAYAKAMAPDARKLDGGQQPAIGRDSILALMARYPAGLSIDWTPEEAVVAESGELGFTWGRYVASARDSNGKLVVQYGKYLDVWKRQSADVWRWIADIGNDNPPPP